MNEHLSELVGRALDHAVPETWTSLNWDQMMRVQEKLSELIIQRCISQIALVGIANFENEDVAWTVAKCIEMINLDFGIEK